MEKPQLFLLHFAGGNCYSFQFITPLLGDFEVISLELPGRGRRMGEKLLNDFESAAEDIYDQIDKKLNNHDFVIYGHSMGAFLAIRVSGMLEKKGRYPTYLVVSGNAGPSIKRERKRYLMNQRELIKELKNLGGIAPELLEHEEFFELYEPVFRADFEIAERYEITEAEAIEAPIYALMGNQEEEVDEITQWRNFTRSHFNYRILEGDHFFIFKHAHKIAGIIKDCYRRSVNVK